MDGQIDGTIERVGVQLTEVYQLRFEPGGRQQEEYQKDPHGFVKQFLEEQGFKVRRVQFLKADKASKPGNPEAADSVRGRPDFQRMPEGAYHIEYPGNEASGWICCCA